MRIEQLKTMDNNYRASRPGRIPLSQERLRRIDPDLFKVSPWMFWKRKQYQHNMFCRTHIEEHLQHGLAEPAIVVGFNPLSIAVYTNEIDCVAFLTFLSNVKTNPEFGDFYPQGLGDEFIARHNLKENNRLLTVNTFFPMNEKGYAPDLRPGPKARGVFGNFDPYIADFLTVNQVLVEERKRSIGEDEWQRCRFLADDYLNHVVDETYVLRDGRPLVCAIGRKQDWIQGHEPISKE